MDLTIRLPYEGITIKVKLYVYGRQPKQGGGKEGQKNPEGRQKKDSSKNGSEGDGAQYMRKVSNVEKEDGLKFMR